ncbi:MAG TPA: AmmeMemoRadiSam system radical SAM enzyme [Candidatus Nanopusillus sp.]|nr:AmmeMemoRadiSam system radical SAM enzyme [Candidatus Nanopusillus sp.]
MKGVLYVRDNDHITCLACARKCKITKNLHGFCGVRYNLNNELIVANWGLFVAIAIDPIEKKPFYHFYPGHSALSLGTVGCSWACKYCQNWDISQRKQLIGIKLEPEEIVSIAKSRKELYDVITITFTYNEPSIYPEYSYEVAKIAKKEGFYISWVSNGYLTEEAIEFASKFLDAITIDIKGNANPRFAKKYILINNYEPVLEALEELYKKGVHIEITDLVIPKIGDRLEDARNLSKRIHDIMGDNSNIHFLRFYPNYKLSDIPPTSINILEKHTQVAKEEGISYVYIGNVLGHKLEHTYCPECGNIVIKRYGFLVDEVNIGKNNRCKFCGYKLYLEGHAKRSRITSPMYIETNKIPIMRKIVDSEIVEVKLSN